MCFDTLPAANLFPCCFTSPSTGKHLQLISGVSPVSYWFSSYLWDMINYLFPMTMIVLLLLIFKDANTLVTAENISATIAVLFMFGASVIPFAYVISFIFKSHIAAQHTLMLVNFIGSIVLLIVTLVFRFNVRSHHPVLAIVTSSSIVKTITLASSLTCLSSPSPSLPPLSPAAEHHAHV